MTDWDELFDFRESMRKIDECFELVKAMQEEMAALKAAISTLDTIEVSTNQTYLPRNRRDFDT